MKEVEVGRWDKYSQHIFVDVRARVAVEPNMWIGYSEIMKEVYVLPQN